MGIGSGGWGDGSHAIKKLGGDVALRFENELPKIWCLLIKLAQPEPIGPMLKENLCTTYLPSLPHYCSLSISPPSLSLCLSLYLSLSLSLSLIDITCSWGTDHNTSTNQMCQKGGNVPFTKLFLASISPLPLCGCVSLCIHLSPLPYCPGFTCQLSLMSDVCRCRWFFGVLPLHRHPCSRSMGTGFGTGIYCVCATMTWLTNWQTQTDTGNLILGPKKIWFLTHNIANWRWHFSALQFSDKGDDRAVKLALESDTEIIDVVPLCILHIVVFSVYICWSLHCCIAHE